MKNNDMDDEESGVNYTEEDDDMEEDVVVSEAVCPHCGKALHVIIEPADHEPMDDDEED